MVLVLTTSRHVIPIERYHILPGPDIWYQLNGIISYQFQTFYTKWKVYLYQFQKSNTNWMISYSTNSRYMIPIELYHVLPVQDISYQKKGMILPVPEIWYQLNDIIFYKFQISDTNWTVSISTNYWHVIPWCHILLVQDIWYRLNGIKFYRFQTCDNNWMVLLLTTSRHVIPIERYHILPGPDIWCQLNGIIYYQFQPFYTKWKE